MTSHQRATISWRPDGVPVSDRFDDPYFSVVDGLAETRHVFLDGNALPARFVPGFHIAELGFGTGLNMFAALLSWRDCGIAGPLRFTSFEAFAMTANEMATALEAFPEVRAIADPFLEAWEVGERDIVLPDLVAEIRCGDARETLPTWSGRADAWFLDGFAPAKNPELWGEDLLRNVAAHTAPDGSFATYSAAGHMRRTLSDAGFVVRRVPGFGRKRHMSVGKLAGDDDI